MIIKSNDTNCPNALYNSFTLLSPELLKDRAIITYVLYGVSMLVCFWYLH